MHMCGQKPVILYLCDYQAPYGGNFIASMLRLDEKLQALDAETLYMFPSGATEREWYRKMELRKVRVFPLTDGGLAKKLRQLLRMIDKNRVTILHVHFGLFLLAELATLCRPKLRLVLHFHSDFSAGKEPTLLMKFRNACKRIPEVLIGKRLTKVTVSECSARTTDDCIRIHNALAPVRLTDTLWSREETRAAYAVPDAAILVLVFGWSPYIKGIDLAVSAMKKIVDNGHPNFRLGVVCGRTYTEARMRAFIRERTDCDGDEPWLVMLPPVEDVFRYHKASDIMLSASRSETFSYALLEAVASGKPCVASAIPGVQWARTFDTVSFFRSEDVATLAEALLALEEKLADRSFNARLGDARAHALRDFGIDEWVDGMCALYGLG